MIPTDHITFDGDTAWWIPDEFGTGSVIRDADRPCDNFCGDIGESCDDCIDGRHTFEIEVEWCNPDLIGAWESKTYRVSIVEGMVLPILQDEDWTQDHWPVVTRAMSVDDQFFVRALDDDGGQRYAYPITLPPAAKPGMWAVQLKVQQ